ncbi:MAG TPA: hypothetical protein PKA13_03095 [Geminicoccaceae bacterium]|nr:hypothetical protein [Geminicoccus sp.]HMU48733.1 hypothetical protein [Geminicoccaceae bacterium]
MAAPTATSCRPSTFQERGVAVPFTTPALAQARVRAVRPPAVELIVANPSGGRGWYVLPAEKVVDSLRLTLHDRLLLEAVRCLPALSPATVRGAARRTAAAGSAGREAAHAVAEAEQREAREQAQAACLLAAGLLKRTVRSELDRRALDADDDRTRESMRAALAEVAPALETSQGRLAACLDEIARHVVPVGLADGLFESRASRTIEALDRFASEVRAWALLEPEDRRPGVELIATCADTTLSRARTCLQRLWMALDATPQLVRQWLADPEVVVARLALPDWLLDGWPYICASWDQATSEDRSAQRVTLARIESLVPSVPTEVGGDAAPAEERLHARRWLRGRDDSRSPAAMARAIGRNEALRAVLA